MPIITIYGMLSHLNPKSKRKWDNCFSLRTSPFYYHFSTSVSSPAGKNEALSDTNLREDCKRYSTDKTSSWLVSLSIMAVLPHFFITKVGRFLYSYQRKGGGGEEGILSALRFLTVFFQGSKRIFRDCWNRLWMCELSISWLVRFTARMISLIKT